jgi:DNA-binding transcriptional ArsR family regulator
MEPFQWEVLANPRGGRNRVRILAALATRPRNAHRLAGALTLDYKTTNHHLGVLLDEGFIQASGHDYGGIYLPTEQARHHWERIEEIKEQLGIDEETNSPS